MHDHGIGETLQAIARRSQYIVMALRGRTDRIAPRFATAREDPEI